MFLYIFLSCYPSYSFVVHYIVEKEAIANGKIGFQASLQRHRHLGMVCLPVQLFLLL